MKGNIKIGALLGYFSIAVTSIVSLVFTPILLRELGTSEYGIYSLVASVIAYFSIFDVGLSSTGIRYISKNYKNEKKINQINGILLKIYFIISVLILIIGGIIFFNIEHIFTALTPLEISKFKISFVIMIGSVAISFPFSVFNSYIIAKEEFVYNKLITLLHHVLKPLIMLPLLLIGYKSIAMIIVIAGLNVLTYLCNCLYAKNKLQFKCDLKSHDNDKEIVKEIFGFSFFIFLSMIVDTIFKNTDQVILGIFSGTIAVSIYDVSMQIRNANTNFSTVISSMFLPKLSKMVEDKEPIEKISEIFIQTSRIQMFILLLILSGFIVFGQPFISLWVGKEYMDAYYIILICMTPSFVPLTQNVGISVIQAMNKHKFRAVMFIIIAVINIVISIPLTMKFGGIGAAIGTAIATILGQIISMNWYYARKIKLNIKDYWKNYAKIVLPVIIFSFIIRPIFVNNLNNWLKFLLGIGIYTIVYVLYILVVITNKYEKELIKKILKKVHFIKE